MCSFLQVALQNLSFSCYWLSSEQLDLSETAWFIGNSLIYFFISTKSRRFSYLQSSMFVRNFNFYVKSLALSDILSCSISLPPIYIQLMFDVFQQGWPCRIVRYLNLLFPSVTINNLIVISTERAEGHFVAHAPRKFVRRVRRHFDIFSALLRVFNWAIDTFLWYFLERDGRVWQVYHHF